MRAVIQRVKKASVSIKGKVTSQIKKGMLILLGVAKEDTEETVDYMVNKVANLRLFEDDQGKINISSLDCNAEILVVSQFTVYGDCRKGRRPSFDKAADPEKGETLYESFVKKLKNMNLTVETGTFRAMMDVELINDGPVTFIVESI